VILTKLGHRGVGFDKPDTKHAQRCRTTRCRVQGNAPQWDAVGGREALLHLSASHAITTRRSLTCCLDFHEMLVEIFESSAFATRCCLTCYSHPNEAMLALSHTTARSTKRSLTRLIALASQRGRSMTCDCNLSKALVDIIPPTCRVSYHHHFTLTILGAQFASFSIFMYIYI